VEGDVIAKCPECKEEISELGWHSVKTVSWGGTASLKKDGLGIEHSHEFDSEDEDYSRENYDTFYTCPECDAELFTEEDKAWAFLKGMIDDEDEE
jgi:uncharacterized protein with PIN domain